MPDTRVTQGQRAKHSKTLGKRTLSTCGLYYGEDIQNADFPCFEEDLSRRMKYEQRKRASYGLVTWESWELTCSPRSLTSTRGPDSPR